MNGDHSYYPPRAKWYSGLYRLWYDLRRVLHLERIQMPVGLGPGSVFLGLVLPGHAFAAFGRKTIGRAFLFAYGLALLVFFATLGYSPASVAFGLMISAHASSVAYLMIRWFQPPTFGTRLGIALLTLLAVGLLVYLPALGIVRNHYLIPLRIGEQVVVTRQGGDPAKVQRGDWVAYEIRGGGVPGGVYVAAGYAIEAVLAVAGDKVKFTPQACLVNGRTLPRQNLMPKEGELVVPEKTWFLWPRLDIRNRNVNPEQITATMLRVALVGHDQYVGRPYRYWFGRRQITP